jgi:isocitrate dehydrogenase
MSTSKIIWTKIDEAPLLATYALLPVVQAFTKGCGIEVETRDISLAGRIIANFPERLTEEQKIPDDLAELGELARPRGQHHQAAQHLGLHPAAAGAIKELQSKGYDIPDFPEEPKTDGERALQAALRGVSRLGRQPGAARGQRRPPAGAVGQALRAEAPAQDDEAVARVRVEGARRAHGTRRLLRQRDLAHAGGAHRGAHRVRRRGRHGRGPQEGPGAPGGRGHRHRGDERRRAARLLRRADRGCQEGRCAAVAPPQGDHDEGLGPHHVRPLRVGVLPGVLDKHAAELEEVGANVNNGLADVLEKLGRLPAIKKAEIEPTSRWSTHGAPPSPWSTRARASPTCTCPTT